MLGSGIASLALLGSGLLGARGVRQHARLTAQAEALEGRALRLEAENEQLRATADALGTPAYCEWAMRQQLGWVRADEVVLILE